MDRFERACAAAAADMGCRGIGTLGEKSLHLTLKYFFAPDPETHERKVGGFIADAVTEQGVIEIQTRGLSRLKPKLEAFLPCCPVTVVHPVISEKRVIRVDENGEVLSVRKSPKHETLLGKMREIYSLRAYIGRVDFQILLPALKLDEYSVPLRRGRYQKLDRVPTALQGIIRLSIPADFRALLPETLPAECSAAMLARAVGGSPSDVRMLLNLLEQGGLAERTGRSGHTQLWRLTDCP